MQHQQTNKLNTVILTCMVLGLSACTPAQLKKLIKEDNTIHLKSIAAKPGDKPTTPVNVPNVPSTPDVSIPADNPFVQSLVFLEPVSATVSVKKADGSEDRRSLTFSDLPDTATINEQQASDYAASTNLTSVDPVTGEVVVDKRQDQHELMVSLNGMIRIGIQNSAVAANQGSIFFEVMDQNACAITAWLHFQLASESSIQFFKAELNTSCFVYHYDMMAAGLLQLNNLLSAGAFSAFNLKYKKMSETEHKVYIENITSAVLYQLVTQFDPNVSPPSEPFVIEYADFVFKTNTDKPALYPIPGADFMLEDLGLSKDREETYDNLTTATPATVDPAVDAQTDSSSPERYKKSL